MPIQIAEQSSSDISHFIANNSVPTSEGRRCIDGRYESNNCSGMIARPGGDLGYVMGLLGLSNREGWQLSAIEAFEAIYKTVQKRGGFYFHSDHSSEVESDGNTHFGCAHVAKPLNPDYASRYDLSPYQVKELIDYARFKTSWEDDVHMSCLDGEHRERALLIVRGTESALKSSNSELDQMYFVYERDRDEEFSGWLVRELALIFPKITEGAFKAELEAQMNATLTLLAPDKEQIEVWTTPI